MRVNKTLIQSVYVLFRTSTSHEVENKRILLYTINLKHSGVNEIEKKPEEKLVPVLMTCLQVNHLHKLNYDLLFVCFLIISATEFF